MKLKLEKSCHCTGCRTQALGRSSRKTFLKNLAHRKVRQLNRYLCRNMMDEAPIVSTDRLS